MKILLINNFHYIKGGSEAVYFNMARMFVENGNQVIFFSCSADENLKEGENKHFVKPNSSVNPVLGAMRYIYNGNAKRALEQLIIEQRPDIAHIHLFWGGLSSSILGILRKHKIPIVHTAHDYRLICPAYTFRRVDGTVCEECMTGNYINCLKYRCSKGSTIKSALMTAEVYFRKWFIKPIKAIDGFVFVSHFSYNQHLKAMPELANKPCIVEHNAIAPMPPSAISSSISDYYLYFGRLSHEKGLITLIEAFSKLPNLKLKIVGTGPQMQELQQIAQKLSNIEFCGYQSGEKLRSTIRDCKAIIVPSEWYENNPMTIIEASAAGVPTIGATIGGIPEIVIDGKTGYLFTPKCIEELIDAVKKMEALTSKQYKEMSDNCQALAAEKFSQQALYPRIIDFYNSILANYDA